ncbi:MAG: hypothetical protein E7058_08370 [Lentisphaerae bacterium]|nr:hypothetical protein [Lentisphaerota bacterium]
MNRIVQVLFKHPLHKIVALGITILLYAVLNEGKQQQKDILNIPVSIDADSDVYVPQGKRRKEVRITVKGSERRLKNMNVNAIVGKVKIHRNMSGFDKGMVKVQLSEKHFSLPQGVEIKSIDPEVIEVTVERLVSKELPIKVVTSGQPEYGYECDEKRLVTQKKTNVAGPESLVSKLNEIETDKIQISSMDIETFTDTVPLNNPDPGALTLNPGSVDVEIKIKRLQIIERSFENIPISWISPLQKRVRVARIGEDNVVLTDNTVKVEISGLQSEVTNIKEEGLVVIADLTSEEFAKNGDFLIKLRPLADDSARWDKIKVIPDQIRVRVTLLD